MQPSIFLLRDGGLTEMKEQPYDSENLLRKLISDYPNLLAGDQIDDASPRRWLFVSSEAPVPSEGGGAGRWAVDNLFLDQDAVPTIVEVKRRSDTRIRREVVGQMLDYAANAVVYWPVEAIRARFEANCELRNRKPEEVMNECLGVGSGAGEFWMKVKTNLQAGKVRLVFVSDEIPPELRRVVEFLNTQMDPAEVLAVEVKQFVSPQGWQTLVPRVIGQTAEALQKKTAATRPPNLWNEASFFEALEARRGPDEADTAKRILRWAVDKLPRFYWGRGAKDGSFFPTLSHKDQEFTPFVIWTYGTIEIQFQTLKSRPPFDNDPKRVEFLSRLNQIPGIELPADSITRRPTFRLAVLNDEAGLAGFFRTMEWVVHEIKAT